jgi:hypothetical protein
MIDDPELEIRRLGFVNKSWDVSQVLVPAEDIGVFERLLGLI